MMRYTEFVQVYLGIQRLPFRSRGSLSRLLGNIWNVLDHSKKCLIGQTVSALSRTIVDFPLRIVKRRGRLIYQRV